VERVVGCLEYHRGSGAGDECIAKEELTFRRVVHGRFLQEDMLAGFERADGPLIMQTIWQRDVDAVNVWIIEDFYGDLAVKY
jgi:hypothetical protein